jgi:general secretion pathway protein C
LQSARRLLRHIDRYPGLNLTRAGSVALIGLLAYQCATLYSVAVTPLEARPERTARPPQLQSATILESFDPFFTAPAGAAPPLAATDLALHGVRQAGPAGAGSAIISQSDGLQRSFGAGEEISTGILLKQVGSDHVIIVRHGLDERLALKAFASTGPAAAPAGRRIEPPSTPAPAAMPSAEIRPRPPAPRRPAGLPARSIDFADPSTLPASLTSGPALPDRAPAPKR